MNEAAPLEEKTKTFSDFVRFALIATAIVLPIRFFVAQPFIVSGTSMVPTFDNAHYLIIDELTYRLGEPKRGEVIVFKFPLESAKYLIKRVIGLPEETVIIKDNSVTIKNSAHPDGFLLDQPGIAASVRSADQAVTLESNEYFVLGDNRDASSDSRIWGPLKRELIIGRPLLRLYPPSKIGLFPGEWSAQE